MLSSPSHQLNLWTFDSLTKEHHFCQYNFSVIYFLSGIFVLRRRKVYACVNWRAVLRVRLCVYTIHNARLAARALSSARCCKPKELRKRCTPALVAVLATTLCKDNYYGGE